MTSSPDSAEKVVAEWRAAMEGVSAGPWRHYRNKLRPNFGGIINEVQCRSKTPVVRWNGFDDSGRKEPKHALNADWIARCSPSGISGLLALIEQQAAELAAVRHERNEAKALADAQSGGNRHACAEWTRTLLKLRDAQKERDAILAAGEALSLALSRYGFPMSDEAWRNTGDDAPANSQASVEARALHQAAAAAFFKAISGAADVG